jgi:hypothetical protein
MNPSSTHILSEHGIMSSFSIAKKISQDQVKKLAQQLNVSEDSKEFQEHLKKQILRDTQIALHNNKIPGIIYNQTVKNTESKQPVSSQQNGSVKKVSLDEKKKAKLALFATLIVQKILEQKSTTEEKCFLIVQIVNGLGLKDSDFKKYHMRHEDVDDTDDEDDEDEF